MVKPYIVPRNRALQHIRALQTPNGQPAPRELRPMYGIEHIRRCGRRMLANAHSRNEMNQATGVHAMNTTHTEKTPASASAQDEEQGRREALYDRFAERTRELFEASQEKGKEAMNKSIEMAREQFVAAGEFSAEQGEAFRKYMRRDLAQTEADMHTLGQEAAERFNPARLGVGALSSMARLLQATGAALQNLSQKAEDALHFNTGEITTAGTLTCTKCGQKVQLKRSAHIPPCPGCHGTEFRKGY
jgi:isocitrate dehydrogenase